MKVELNEIGEWMGMGWMEWHYALDCVKNTNAIVCDAVSESEGGK